MKQTHITTISLIAVIFLTAVVSMASAEDAPSMWMVQDGDNIDLMVNTSEVSDGANAWIHFDPACVNITDVSVIGSPWVPLESDGWSHQSDHIRLVLINFEGVAPGEYRIARLTMDCVSGDCTSAIEITAAEPVGVVVHNTTFTCSTPAAATISIGSGKDVVTLPIRITDADNVGAVDVTLSYDPAAVNVVGVSDGGMDHTCTNLENVSEGWIRVGAVQGANPGLSGQFTLLNVNFEPVVSGAQCSLDLSVTTFKDATPEGNTMPYSTINGAYTSSTNGDANGDDVVDMADALYLIKHVVGIKGYESIDEDASDVNGDGIIDMHDALYLIKHIVGVPGFEDLR